MLKYWPFANHPKEFAFLTILIELVEVVVNLDDLRPLVRPICIRIAKCLTSDHIRLADRAQEYFKNDHFCRLIIHFKEVAYPILVTVID